MAFNKVNINLVLVKSNGRRPLYKVTILNQLYQRVRKLEVASDEVNTNLDITTELNDRGGL